MMKSRQEVLKIVSEFRDELSALYGDRLRGVYLYGSYARDEADEDSDIDVAVVLEGPVHRHGEIQRVSELRASICLRETCVLMPFFLTVEDYENAPYSLYRSIQREAVAV